MEDGDKRFDEYKDHRNERRDRFQKIAKEIIVPELDKVYDENKKAKENGSYTFKNILFIEPVDYDTGRVIDQWLDDHDDINPYFFLANTSPHIQKLIFGDGFSELLFSTKELDNINQKDRVLVIERFDMTDLKVRDHMKKLIEYRIANDISVEGGKRKLEELWYIIAIAYPEGHFGYEALADNDISIFDTVVRLDNQ